MQYVGKRFSMSGRDQYIGKRFSMSGRVQYVGKGFSMSGTDTVCWKEIQYVRKRCSTD